MFTSMDTMKLITRMPPEVLSLVAKFLNPNYVKIFGMPFLAGGAVRDSLLDKPIRDWDIYFPFRKYDREDVSTIVTLLGAKWYTASSVSLVSDDDVYDKTYLYVRAWIPAPMGTTLNTSVDLIFSGQDITDFDHGICQCKLDFYPEAKLTTTRLFEECVQNHYHIIKQKNLTNPYVTNKSINLHTPRILEKYPWPVMVSYE